MSGVALCLSISARTYRGLFTPWSVAPPQSPRARSWNVESSLANAPQQAGLLPRAQREA